MISVPGITTNDTDGDPFPQPIMRLVEWHRPSDHRWIIYLRSLSEQEQAAKRDALTKTYRFSK